MIAGGGAVAAEADCDVYDWGGSDGELRVLYAYMLYNSDVALYPQQGEH